MMFGGGMKIYTVHVKSGEPRVEQKPVFVKEGFTLLAFIFPLFWSLYHRLWKPAILLLVLNGFIMYLMKSHLLGELSVGAVDLGVHVLVGFQANDWVRARLQKKGYIFADVTAADSLLRAEQRYFERYLAASS